MTWNAENTGKTVTINGTSYDVESTQELINKIQDVAENTLHLARFKVYIGSFEVENAADMKLDDVSDDITLTPYDKAA